MKVLVVDDDRSARDFAARVLAEAGYEVSTVDSGQAALTRLPEGFEIVGDVYFGRGHRHATLAPAPHTSRLQ